MSYPDAFPKDSFEVHTSVTHTPTGLKFVQSGGRILVLKQRGFDGLWAVYNDFTTNELQEFGVVLTKGKLIREAIDWMKDNKDLIELAH